MITNLAGFDQWAWNIGGENTCVMRWHLEECECGRYRSKAMPVDLVIFDCDGVLIDSEIISARMLIAELSNLGVQIDLDYVATHFLGRSYPTVMKQIRTEFGLDLPIEFEDQYRTRLMAAFAQELSIMPGVAQVLMNICGHHNFRQQRERLSPFNF